MPETVYSQEQINRWRQGLKELASQPRTRFTKKQAVESLIEQVEEALQSHPYDQVAESLKEWGLEISAGSLKQYVNAYRRMHRSDTSAKGRKHTRKGKQGTRSKQSTNSIGNASVNGIDNRTVGSNGNKSVNTIDNRSENRTDNAAVNTVGTMQNHFIEMDEDL